jgi:hypothetical protein
MIKELFAKTNDLAITNCEHLRGSVNRCRPLRGLDPFCGFDPGAYAPGFMLTPTSRAGENYE